MLLINAPTMLFASGFRSSGKSLNLLNKALISGVTSLLCLSSNISSVEQPNNFAIATTLSPGGALMSFSHPDTVFRPLSKLSASVFCDIPALSRFCLMFSPMLISSSAIVEFVMILSPVCPYITDIWFSNPLKTACVMLAEYRSIIHMISGLDRISHLKAFTPNHDAASGFYDWVKVFQEYPFDLPRKASRIIRHFDGQTDELLAETAPAFMAEGSYCTSMRIHVCGRKITVDGNPSRINRLDNVFGLSTLSDCMRVINSVLLELGLPAMTRCTTVQRLQDGSAVVDGAVFQRLDLTNNAAVGKFNEQQYIRALSSQRFRHSIGYVYPDMNTAVWTPKGGEKAGRLVYPGVYNKAAEISAHLLPKVRRTFGEDSDEFTYVKSLRDWCSSIGMVRYEIKLRAEYLKRERFCYWGLFSETELWGIHAEFLQVGDKMSLQAYDVVSIAQELISKGICKSMQSAGCTARYAYEWMAGASFDLSKRQVQEHRAKLREIGMDIKFPHDSTRNGVVFIRNVREVDLNVNIKAPNFYRSAQLPRHLQLVA